jgi:hypothetical protein
VPRPAAEADAARAEQAEHWERAKQHGEAAKSAAVMDTVRLQNLAASATSRPLAATTGHRHESAAHKRRAEGGQEATQCAGRVETPVKEVSTLTYEI